MSGAREPVFLVTGAAGQLGRAMGRRLEERGLSWRGVDVVASDGSAPFLRCDLADPASVAPLREFCRGVTHVLHLAGRITNDKSIVDSYAEQFRISVRGTLNLLAGLSPETRHFSFASSMTVYGRPRRLPVDERHPVEPSCVYALCKLAAERYLEEEGRARGLGVCLLRYTSAYGPGRPDGRAIHTMIQNALAGRPPEVHGDGTVQRDYIFQDDLCRATIEAALKEARGVLNVGSGVGTSVADLARRVLRLTGTPGEPVFAARAQDPQSSASMVYDIGKLRALLGDFRFTPLDEGLAATIAGYKDGAARA